MRRGVKIFVHGGDYGSDNDGDFNGGDGDDCSRDCTDGDSEVKMVVIRRQ